MAGVHELTNSEEIHRSQKDGVEEIELAENKEKEERGTGERKRGAEGDKTLFEV